MKDGGPAYPADKDAVAGMSLLDHFAGLAMQALVVSWADSDPRHADGVAKASYDFAAAMLAEKERREK